MTARMLYLHALTPIHSGTGQSAGVIDQPVAREKVYSWPYLPGSGIKGVLRDACDPGPSASPDDQSRFRAAFGAEAPRSGAAGPQTEAGALWFSDGHLLCLPVRSYFGSFAWITCPLALQRWLRDYTFNHLAAPVQRLPASPGTGEALIVGDSAPIRGPGALYLEDLDLKARTDPELDRLANAIGDRVFDDPAWRGRFCEHLAVVGDDTFTFLAETATDVSARIQLEDDTKTVQSGHLWYEEAVPAESLFSCPVLPAPGTGSVGSAVQGGSAAPVAHRLRHAPDLLFQFIDERRANVPLQFGGNASVGRGLCQVRIVAEPEAAP